MNLPGQLYEAVQDLRELPEDDAQEREQHLRGKYQQIFSAMLVT